MDAVLEHEVAEVLVRFHKVIQHLQVLQVTPLAVIEDVEVDSNIPQRDLFKKIYNEYGHESHWLAFIDDDEYIMSLQELNFLSFLKSVENKNGVELASRFSGLTVIRNTKG